MVTTVFVWKGSSHESASIDHPSRRQRGQPDRARQARARRSSAPSRARSETRPSTLLDDIPSNHKFAPVDIKAGEPIIKYGLNIGRASCDIQQGQYVHIHNIESNRGRGDLQTT